MIDVNREERENRITEIMTKMANDLEENGPLSLTEMSKPYREENEMGPCLIAFSRLEAEGLIVQKPNGKWKISQR
ncbi:hypothetical protein AKJ61_00080 [candidate division MSBL1 archaeon SCGC-AAA259B11]|uniref:DprA winged helix domain-containing protein n=1 Tax=candidate division MSBL1 archaeon SCGC-AAA259B11 TaxID=1698260 RepID=A0A133U902_9EURY|nr:hypothetical protein AKJ61_00080 [candidate division MSBL1 archaeon SCGC-AAA259B11]